MSADSVRGTASGSSPAPADAGSSRWYDAEAGPVVRPYAMTRGVPAVRPVTVST